MQSAHRFGFGVLFRVGTPQTRHGSIMRTSVCDSGRAEASQKAINPAQRRPPPRQSPTARARFKTLIYLKGFGVGACGGPWLQRANFWRKRTSFPDGDDAT